MMGEWNRLFSYYEEQPETRKDVKICKLNCDEHKQFCLNLGVQQFPTIKLFIAGSKDSVHLYQGNRRFEDFNHWMNHHIAPRQAQQEDELKQQQMVQQQQQSQQQLIQQQLQQRQQQEAAERSRQEEVNRQQEWARQREEEIKNLEDIQKRQKASEQQHEDELRRIQELEREISQRQEKQHTQQENNNNQGNTDNNSNIQTSLQQLEQRITMLSKNVEKIDRLNINSDYVNSKLEIITEEQKLLLQQINRIIDVQENMQKIIKIDGKSTEQGKEEQQQQQHNNNNNNSLGNRYQSSQFSVLPAILFLLAGTALGYLFFVLRGNKTDKQQTLLVSQHSQEMGKAN